jgi:hypothetical protein
MNTALISVLRHRLQDAAKAAPPKPDDFRTDAIVSVISGAVVGEVDRVLYRDETGRVEQFFEARIDGIRRGSCGFADVETDASESLASLAAVAQYLADEMTRLQDDAAANPSDDAALFRTNDGHGHRVIVEKRQHHRGVRITIRTSNDDRDAQTAVLSRRAAIALRDSLEAL